MRWLNSDEIDDALDVITRHAPEFAPYAKFLADWRDTVNDNSDGWSYWTGGSKPAGKLCDLVKKTSDAVRYGDGELPSHDEFRKSLSPVKSAATRHNLPKPELDETPVAGPRFR